MKRTIAAGLRSVGLHLQKHHDAYLDARRLIGNVTHAVDGGAHRGTITARLLEVFPRATVHAFEPQAEQFGVLSSVFGRNPRVLLNHAALGSEPGTARLNINKGCYSSLLRTLTPETMEATGATQEVPVTTLDAWSADCGAVPEFLKLDLQGFELPCLQGAAAILSSGVRAVVTEINFRPRYEGSCLFHEVAGLLYGHGFQMFRAYELWGGASGEWLQGDALFVRRELLTG